MRWLPALLQAGAQKGIRLWTAHSRLITIDFQVLRAILATFGIDDSHLPEIRMHAARSVFSAVIIALAPVRSASSATEYYGPVAQQIVALINSGQAACFVTTSVVNPASNAVEQSYCKCVTRITGNARDRAGNLTAVVVNFGPEHPCNAPPQVGPTSQQRQDAARRISEIDNYIQVMDQSLRTMDDRIDRRRYHTEPNYRAVMDQWKQGEWARGQAQRNQLMAERATHVSIANAPSSGQPQVRPVPPTGATNGQAMPGLLTVPMQTH